ncbi:hypothetical protein L0F63_002307 [Massospora cicadina]|nr:hypothetical protein L0F63_002307 [Massospora cicadina]
MVRFRGKARGRPTPVSDLIGAELRIQLETASRAEVQTPSKRAVETFPASTSRRSARTASKKNPPLSPKRDIYDASLISQSTVTDPKPHKPTFKSNKSASRTEILEDQRWDEYSIFDDSLPRLDDNAPEPPASVFKVKKEVDRDFPEDDPFGFLQVESEVKESSSSSLLAREISPVRRVTQPSTKPTFASTSGTPERRRSTRLLSRPSTRIKDSGVLRATNRRLPSIPEKEDTTVTDPKLTLELRSTSLKSGDSSQKPNTQKRSLKRKKVDGEKLLQEERTRLLEKFKAVDGFKLESRVV